MAASPDKYELWVYGSDKGYKGDGTFLSKEGLAADKTDKVAGGTANDGSSANIAKPGSVLLEIFKEFPAKEVKGKEGWGSPFVWFETKDGSKKKLKLVGGLSDLKEQLDVSKNFADNATVMKYATVEPMGWGMINMLNNYSPGYTTPTPLSGA